MPFHGGENVLAPQIERAKGALVWDGAWSNVVGVLTGGVLLVGFALELGAGPLVIGVLGSVPFFSQLAQIPAILLIEWLRRRRVIAIVAATSSRAVVLGLAFLPFIDNRPLARELLVAACVVIATLSAVGACAWNSWMHDLLPKEQLGRIFSHRLFWATGFALAAGLGSGVIVDHWPGGARIDAYAVLFGTGAVAGFLSSFWLSRVPEPPMDVQSERPPLRDMLTAPLRDPWFQPLLRFNALWNFTSNLTAPFFAVYFVQQLGLSLGVVVGLWAVSQLANMLTLQVWGRLSDRLSNRAILAVGAPVYLGAVLALPFSAIPAPHPLTVPVLGVMHIVMGTATAAIGLASGNIGLKSAPAGRATEYLASMSLVGSLAAGVAPLLGGAIASLLERQEFAILIHWGSGAGGTDMTALRFQHWEFLFVLSFIVGLYAVSTLSLVREGREVSERDVIRRFFLEARRTMRSLSTVSGLRVATLFPLGWLTSGRAEEARHAPGPSQKSGQDD
jgi:MFS family permease